jgi:GMP synthase-like glutamine amidotransferase
MGLPRIKLLVLETDEPHPETKDERGSFGKIFHNLFAEAGCNHDPPLGVETDMHFVVDDPKHGHHGHVPNANDVGSDVAGILITGSMYDAHGDNPWIINLLNFLRELWISRPGFKFAGVCFGHQLLNRLLGGKVDQHPGERWELSHTSMDLTPVGQKLFRTSDKKLSLHQMHQDHVTELPSAERSNGLLKDNVKVHVWASSPHTEVQGVYIRDRVFTSQGHLGFDEKMVHRQIELRKQSGSINEDDAEEVTEAQEKAHLKHDGVVVAAAILRFLHGDDHDID